MTTPPTRVPWSTRKLLVVAILLAVIAGGLTGFGTAYLARPPPAAQSREFYLFPEELEFNASLTTGLKSSYIFIPDRIAVNKGDKVIIHFYNPSDDDHTFTMVAPYANDVTVVAATTTVIRNSTVTFAANTAGIFIYHCRFHPPQMTGTLIVQG